MIKKIYTQEFENGLECFYIKKKESLYITIEIWVRVGACNEMPHEYGISHMIEHMLFKGSHKIPLGFLDMIFYIINGKTNAYTSKDFTVYSFSVPRDYFELTMTILFDLFEEPRFEESDLVTEKEVIIQEIQLYADDSFSNLLDASFKNSNSKYNYEHEILGSDSNVKSFTEKQLSDFYKKYYIPANMKIFILGDLPYKKIKEVMGKNQFSLIEKADNSFLLVKPQIFNNKKIKKINYIYSETLNKHFLLTYIFPACTYSKINFFKSMNFILGEGRDSLLYEKLHIELKLVTDIRSFYHGFMHETYFFIYFNPVSLDDVALITTQIYEIINLLIDMNYSDSKLEKINNILTFQHDLLLCEETDDFITQYAPYAFEKKINFLLNKAIPIDIIKNKISILARHFNNKKSYINALLPFSYQKNIDINTIESIKKDKNIIVDDYSDLLENDNSYSDDLVNLELLKKERMARLDLIKSSYMIEKKNMPNFVPFCDSEEFLLPNKLKLVFINDREDNDVILIAISLKVRSYYDDNEYLGGVAFLFDWLYEGTLNFRGSSFIETIEKYGIEFSVSVGYVQIKCLKKYIEIAINLLADFLQYPEFALDRFHLLKMQTIDNIKNFMDDAVAVGMQEIRSIVYVEHPYSKNPSGTLLTVERLTPEIVKSLYDFYITPDEAVLFVVGNVDALTVKKIIEEKFNNWNYKKIENLVLPAIKNDLNKNIIYKQIDKDQVVIFYGGLSVKKYSEEFYYLLLADQILSGSITESMHSILFQIRDLTGMFYDISGSLVSGCSDDCGMVIIKAMTDKQHCELAIKNINQVIDYFINFLTDEDLLIAKKALLLAMAEKNSSKGSILNSFVNKYRFNLTFDDFKNNYNIVRNATIKNIKKTVKHYFNQERLKILLVGSFNS